MDFVEDSSEVRAIRRENVFKHRQYAKHLNVLDDFHIYVLDKPDVVKSATNVLDSLHYADSPEIEAFLQHFKLSMLRLRPCSE